MFTYLLIYLLIGSFTGVLAGLFGVGGGTIIVPALILTLGWQGVSADVSTHIAIGTSLAAIGMTSLSSVHAHHQHGAVRWPLVWPLVPGVALGVWLGAAIASQMRGVLLQQCFGFFLILLAAQMSFGLQPREGREAALLPRWAWWVAGGLIGLLSAIFGIGGGSFTVPFLNWHKVTMQQAVATAAAVGVPIAWVGALSYAWQGWGHAGLPDSSTGFIYWPAFAGIAATSVVFARLGAQMAHLLDAQKLRQLFAVFLLCIGVYFLIQ